MLTIELSYDSSGSNISPDSIISIDIFSPISEIPIYGKSIYGIQLKNPNNFTFNFSVEKGFKVNILFL